MSPFHPDRQYPLLLSRSLGTPTIEPRGASWPGSWASLPRPSGGPRPGREGVTSPQPTVTTPLPLLVSVHWGHTGLWGYRGESPQPCPGS